MSDYDNAIIRLATEQEAEPEDFTGEDGLIYCGKCRQPKEACFAEGKSLFGRDRHPKECDCQRKRREMLKAADREQKQSDNSGDNSHREICNFFNLIPLLCHPDKFCIFLNCYSMQFESTVRKVAYFYPLPHSF